MAKEEIFIKNVHELDRKINIMQKGGASRLHIVSDFDRTLTKVSSKGHNISTSFDPLERGIGHPEFIKNVKEMLDYYYPIEISMKIPMRIKLRKMDEWWNKYFSLAIKHGMKKSIMEKAAKRYKMEWRGGAKELIRALRKKNIPLLVFSAGVGNVIEGRLRKEGLLSKNVHIVSNFFKFDRKGKAVGFSKSLVHVFNKNESLIKHSGYKKKITGRDNVILIGDSPGDLTMADGLKHDCVIKIGFYNHKTDERIKKYINGYDVVIKNNRSMHYVNKLMHELVG